jgi:CO dehydrogenase nickel-insertion accessory protein CooC1
MYVIIVNGKGTAGKTTCELFIEEYMKKKGEKVKKISIIDYTK